MKKSASCPRQYIIATAAVGSSAAAYVSTTSAVGSSAVAYGAPQQFMGSQQRLFNGHTEAALP